MSSFERSLCLALCTSLLAFALYPAASAQRKEPPTAVVCPASITVSESAAPIPGWKVVTAKIRHSFERITIYNATVGGREFELAPDSQKEGVNRITQTWNLTGYRTMKVFLRCRYHDTSVVLLMDLPPEIGTCTLGFANDSHGRVVGKSDMECR